MTAEGSRPWLAPAGLFATLSLFSLSVAVAMIQLKGRTRAQRGSGKHGQERRGNGGGRKELPASVPRALPALCVSQLLCSVTHLGRCAGTTSRQRLADLCHEHLATRTLQVHLADHVLPSPKTLEHCLHHKPRPRKVLVCVSSCAV